MKLNNSALQELYDTLTTGTFVFTPSGTDPIDEAFRECDEKLSDSITFAHIKDLQDRNDILEESNKSLLAGNLNLSTEKNILKNRISRLEELLLDANNTLEKVNADRNELQEAFDKLFEEKRKLNVRTDCLRYEVEWYRKHYKEQSDKIKELKSTLNSICGDEYIKKLQDLVSKNCYDQGQTDLWVKLQNVNNSQPFELATCFPDVTGMEDILSWDLEDFLDAYESWQKKKEQERIKYMRDYLERFCRGRLCSRCPLGSDEYKCRCAYSFNGAHPIPDEDIKRYYEKARACSKPVCRFEREYTFEGTINVEFNKELLNKVCGIDSDD